MCVANFSNACVRMFLHGQLDASALQSCSRSRKKEKGESKRESHLTECSFVDVL